MTPQSIYAFIAARDEKHKTYLREGIFNTKKSLK